jgi:hypothetical protein
MLNKEEIYAGKQIIMYFVLISYILDRCSTSDKRNCYVSCEVR